MQEPSRQLGYFTYINNFLTQIYLKMRALFLIALSSFLGAFAITIIIFIKLYIKVYEGFSVVFHTFKYKIFTGQGLHYLGIVFSMFLHVLLETGIVVVFISVIFFYFSYTFLKSKSAKLYKKKYVRGVEIIEMKELIKKLNKEE